MGVHGKPLCTCSSLLHGTSSPVTSIAVTSHKITFSNPLFKAGFVILTRTMTDVFRTDLLYPILSKEHPGVTCYFSASKECKAIPLLSVLFV